jgi:FixJ family two-component response regulator
MTAIIDDDEDVRDVLGVLLETAGYSVWTYKSQPDTLPTLTTMRWHVC